MLQSIKRFFSSQPSQLAELLGNPSIQEDLLGMLQPVQPDAKRILDDANQIVKHSRDLSYGTWAKEAWAEAVNHIDALQDPKLSMEAVNFHRGALRATMNLLRISYQAREVKRQLDEESASQTR